MVKKITWDDFYNFLINRNVQTIGLGEEENYCPIATYYREFGCEDVHVDGFTVEFVTPEGKLKKHKLSKWGKRFVQKIDHLYPSGHPVMTDTATKVLQEVKSR